MPAPSEGRRRRQEEALRQVGRQSAGPGEANTISGESLFDDNEKEVSAQSVGLDVDGEKVTGYSQPSVDGGPGETAAADVSVGKPKRKRSRGRAPDLRLELSVIETDESQRDWVLGLMLKRPMARRLEDEARSV